MVDEEEYATTAQTRRKHRDLERRKRQRAERISPGERLFMNECARVRPPLAQ